MKVSNMNFLTEEQKEKLMTNSAVVRNNGNIHSTIVVNALKELIEKGITRTGKSGYGGGYATKKIWTYDVAGYARHIGLNVETGNDAPRGGAHGEYVRVEK